MKDILLAIRKSRRMTFRRHDSHKQKALRPNWRKPRGLHSKQRLNERGYKRGVSKGFSSPLAVRHLHPSGLRAVYAESISSLNGLNPENDGIIISRRLGTLKRAALITEAAGKNFRILNVKDPQAELKRIDEETAQRKEQQKKALSTKKEKAKERDQKAKEKEKEKKPESEDDLAEKITQEQGKKEQDKALITRT